MSDWRKIRRKIWSFYRKPTKLETKIVECLARSGPLNVNQVTRKIHQAYSSTRKAMFNLVEKGIIIESGIMIIEQTRLETKTYDLTLKGVLLILKDELRARYTERLNYGLIHKIIRKYNSLLPLIFGKWGHFDKMNVEKTALIRLKIIADNPDLFRVGNPDIPGKTMEQKINWLFYLGSLFPFNFLVPKDPIKWVNAWKEDEDIKAFSIKEIKHHIKRYENAITLYKRYLFTLRNV